MLTALAINSRPSMLRALSTNRPSPSMGISGRSSTGAPMATRTERTRPLSGSSVKPQESGPAPVSTSRDSSLPSVSW